MNKTLTTDNFNTIMARYAPVLNGGAPLAVAVSGGGDSLALAHLLSRYCATQNRPLHILTVDHKLRPESAQEAKQVAHWVEDWPQVTHFTLSWDDADKPSTRIQESARAARHALLEAHCRAHGIKALFFAHHLNDQYETFLMRLTSGSGLSGLCVMDDIVESSDDFFKIRPLLSFTHETILDYLKTHNLNWIEDPSNQNDKFKRVRFRKAEAFLSEEGLSLQRIDTLITRLNRAEDALNSITDATYTQLCQAEDTQNIRIDLSGFLSAPEEIGLRILKKALQNLQGQTMPYPPNSEKLEALYSRITHEKQDFKGATLYKCQIALKDKKQILSISVE